MPRTIAAVAGGWRPGAAIDLGVAHRERSAKAERMHPLDVPGYGDEAPLAVDVIESAQLELAESHHRFDDAEHRFGDLLAQPIEFFAVRRLETPSHGFDRCRVVGRRRRRGKSL